MTGTFSDGMFSDGTFSDGMVSDGTFSDGTFCMRTEISKFSFNICAVNEVLYYIYIYIM